MKHSRSLSIAVFLVLGIGAITFLGFRMPQQQPEKKYSVVLTINEWQAVINAVSSPDDFSNNQKKQVAALITSNLKEVADSTKKK